MCGLSKEKSKAPSEGLLNQYVGRLTTVDNSPPIHHTKTELSNWCLMLHSKPSKLSVDFMLYALFLDVFSKINGLKLGFYYTPSNTSLNVVSK